jgi:hypothetical protein
MKKTRWTGHPQKFIISFSPFFAYTFTHVIHSLSTYFIARLVGLGLDMGWTASSTRSFAFYALEIIGHSPLHIPCITRRLCNIATSTHLRRLKRDCSCASCSTVTPHSHHSLSIVVMSLHPDILLKLHHYLIPHSRTSASSVRMFPRFARLRRLIHAP